MRPATAARRVIAHCLQFVLLLAVLVSEVIIQQHQLLQKGHFDSLPTTAAPRADGSTSSGRGGHYQPLPGSATEAGDADGNSGGSSSQQPGARQAGKQQHQRQLEQQRYQPW
jgi:hypothetical protein